MKTESKFKKPIYTGAVAIGLALGTMGIASAATSQPAPPAPDETAVEVDVQDPAYTGSIQAPVDTTETAQDETTTEADEAAEAAQLEGFATISADEASAAATAAVPGEVTTVELDNENGSVVYSVGIVDSTGAEIDVKVDAGDGTVLDKQADDESEDESATEADDDDVQHENEHDGDNDPDAGHED